jgi:Cation transporter/ATPase, N-terminus
LTLLASPDAGALPITAPAAAAMDPNAVLETLGSSPDGLPGREAGTRLARLGPNALAVESRSLLTIVLEQARNGINLLLAGAGVLTIVTGDGIDGASWSGPPHGRSRS